MRGGDNQQSSLTVSRDGGGAQASLTGPRRDARVLQLDVAQTGAELADYGGADRVLRKLLFVTQRQIEYTAEDSNL